MSRVIALDIETERLKDPERIWCVCTEDIQTGETQQFLNLTTVPEERERFLKYCEDVGIFVFHAGIQFDAPQLSRLVQLEIPPERIVDTLVLSRLDNYSIPDGHSLEAWGVRLGYPKDTFSDFSQLSPELLNRCKVDTGITARLYRRFHHLVGTPASTIEHYIAHICEEMHHNGFYFDLPTAEEYLSTIKSRMKELEGEFNRVFPPKLEVVKTLKYRVLKDGSLPKSLLDAQRTHYRTQVQGPFFLCYDWVPFDPASPRDRIDRLWEAGWQPKEKTKGHLQFERASRYVSPQDPQKKERFRKYGWTLSEENLRTLPEDAPEGAHKLAEWLSLEGRRSTLVEWINCYGSTDGRIHGRFQHIGSWTGRLSHSNPNQANVTAPFHGEVKSAVDQVRKDYDGPMRALFCVPPPKDDYKEHWLVGTDAEGIQLRILAHLMQSQEYVDAIVRGDKNEGTDIHNMNRRALGVEGLTRDQAKTFIYAFLLGAGDGKVGQILGVSPQRAGTAISTFMDSIPGLRDLKERYIPQAASRGYFHGLDGRKVPIPSAHKALAGMLQNGEAVIMKHATRLWTERLRSEGIPFKLVTWPHDEWQTEVYGCYTMARFVGQVQREAIAQAGVDLQMFCPLEGSTDIGKNWAETH